MTKRAKFQTNDPITAVEAMAIAMAKRWMEIDTSRGNARSAWRDSVDDMAVDFGHLAEIAMITLVDWSRHAVAHADDLLGMNPEDRPDP